MSDWWRKGWEAKKTFTKTVTAAATTTSTTATTGKTTVFNQTVIVHRNPQQVYAILQVALLLFLGIFTVRENFSNGSYAKFLKTV